ncbi:MAG: hypothetical protein ACXWHF_07395 [Chthoniobacterales bacterium]
MSDIVIEPATFEDLDELSGLLGELFEEESDFRPDKEKQLRGLRLIFEQPNRGRVFVLRRDRTIVGMINLLFTISTAEGGFVILLEDLVIHKSFAVTVTVRSCSSTRSTSRSRKISSASRC